MLKQISSSSSFLLGYRVMKWAYRVMNCAKIFWSILNKNSKIPFSFSRIIQKRIHIQQKKKIQQQISITGRLEIRPDRVFRIPF